MRPRKKREGGKEGGSKGKITDHKSPGICEWVMVLTRPSVESCRSLQTIELL
jgi:hypothetical protein